MSRRESCPVCRDVPCTCGEPTTEHEPTPEEMEAARARIANQSISIKPKSERKTLPTPGYPVMELAPVCIEADGDGLTLDWINRWPSEFTLQGNLYRLVREEPMGSGRERARARYRIIENPRRI